MDEIKWVDIGSVTPYPNNPRKNGKAIEYVANSISEFGWKQPLVLDKDGVIIVGHTRYEAAKKLGIDKVPAIFADDLTKEQAAAYRLVDNKTNEFAEWDFSMLDTELDALADFDMSEFGFSMNGGDESSRYTPKAEIPQYDVKGEYVLVEELCDCGKVDSLIASIEDADGISQSEREFLVQAAHRHTVFDYQKIAEYYAQASPIMQRLMEASALVIIDIDDAIAKGYARLAESVAEMRADAE